MVPRFVPCPLRNLLEPPSSTRRTNKRMLPVANGEPVAFGIYSKWANESARKLHTLMPRTVRSIAAAEQLPDRPARI
jgi:hypothetical protein